MRPGVTALSAVLGAVVVLFEGGDAPAPGMVEGPAEIAVGVLNPVGAEEARVERETALRRMNGHYVGVRDEVLKCLRRRDPGIEKGIAYASPIHWALQTVRFWRIADAERDIVDRCAITLIPSTVPVGRDMMISDFYPFAAALVALPVRTELLLSRMSAENFRALTWVLAKSRGRDEAVLLLKHHLEGGRYDAAVLKESLELLQKVRYEDELLPIPWKQGK